MTINLNSSNVGTRENRLGSITGYIGSLSDLASQSECGTLRGCARCFSQSSSCLSMCALSELNRIRNVAVIHHGPAGCSVVASLQEYLTKGGERLIADVVKATLKNPRESASCVQVAAKVFQ